MCTISVAGVLVLICLRRYVKKFIFIFIFDITTPKDRGLSSLRSDSERYVSAEHGS